jgi:hypothetical protein
MIPKLFVTSAALIFFAVGFAAADSPATAPPATTAPATTAPATSPTTAPIALTWDQAKDHIGETAIVTGPVVGIHDFGGAAVLNVGKDFPDPSRFTVYITKDKRAGMPDDLDTGKTISVTGKLKMFHRVPEIEADSTTITIVPAATTGPATQP